MSSRKSSWLPLLPLLFVVAPLQLWQVQRELTDPLGREPQLFMLLWPLVTVGLLLAALLWQLLHPHVAPGRRPAALAALALLPLAGAGAAYALRGVSSPEQDRASAWAEVERRLNVPWEEVPCPLLPGWTGAGEGRCFATRADATVALRRLQSKSLGDNLTLNRAGDVLYGSAPATVRAASGRAVPFAVDLAGRMLVNAGEPGEAGLALREAGLFSVLRVREAQP